MKKTIFPFYNTDRHFFLIEKWWFRTIIVIYIFFFLISPFLIWSWHVNLSAGWCYDSLPLYYDYTSFNERLSECSELGRNAWVTGVPIAILGWLIIHYLIQIIFFKVIIDYIVLNNKRR